MEADQFKETFMKTKFVAAVAVFAALSAGPAFAQAKAAAKASEADVQKLVDSSWVDCKIDGNVGPKNSSFNTFDMATDVSFRL